MSAFRGKADIIAQGLEYGLGAARPGTIVERQNDFLVAQEIVPLGVLD
jgi:hypothetical protein